MQNLQLNCQEQAVVPEAVTSWEQFETGPNVAVLEKAC